MIQMHFPREVSTNNTAEYEGLLAGLRIAADLGIKKLVVRGNLQLVVKQVNKDYQSPLMKAYVDEVRKLEERFDGIQLNTFLERRTISPITCPNARPSSYLWNQVPLCFS